MSSVFKIFKNKLVLVCFKAALAIGLLVWLFASGKIDLAGLVSMSDLPLHVLGVAVLGVGVVAQGVRWWLLLRAQGISISMWGAVKISLIGLFGSLVLPGSAGIEVIRTYYITRHAPDRKLAGLTSVLLDRFLGLFAFFVASAVGLAWLAHEGSARSADAVKLLPVVLVPLVGMPVALVLNTIPGVRTRVLRLLPKRFAAPLDASLAAIHSDHGALAMGLGLSFVNTTACILGYYIAGRICSSYADGLTVAAVTPIIVVLGALPITPSGLGVTEASAAVLFLHFGVRAGATMALLNRVWLVTLAVPGALLYIFRGHKMNRELPQSPAPEAL